MDKSTISSLILACGAVAQGVVLLWAKRRKKQRRDAEAEDPGRSDEDRGS